jgi:hypothetical protein
MTNHVGRLYALALALLVFFVMWASVAARPWATSGSTSSRDPRLAALAAREQRLRRESVVVARVVRRRWAVYRVELRKRRAQIAAAKQAQLAPASAPAPSVQVVNLPPLTITRTS